MSTQNVLNHDYKVGNSYPLGSMLPAVCGDNLIGTVSGIKGEWLDTEITMAMSYQGVAMGEAIISPQAIYEGQATLWAWIWA